MKETHRYGIASRKVHLKPTSVLSLISHAPRGWAGCAHEPLALALRCPFRAGRPGPAGTTASLRCRGVRGRPGPGEAGRRRAEGQRVDSGTWHPSYTRSLLVSTSTSVGGQGAAEEGTAISIYLDCFGATKARSDGHRVQVKPEHLREGLGWGSNLSGMKAQGAGPCWCGGGGDSAPAGV